MPSVRPWVLCVLLVAACAAPAPDAWRAGVGRAVITPDEPVWLSGYANRDHPAEGRRHDLWTKALAIEDPSGARAVLITSDLIGVTAALSEDVAEALRRAHGLPREAVLVTASHTHTGPALEGNLPAMVDLPAAERGKIAHYTASVRDRMVRAAGDALASLHPARLAWGNGTADFAVNRRNNKEPDVPALRAAGKLLGPVDHHVPVLRARTPDGSLLAVVGGYACHCTTLNDYFWSGDYAGFAQIELETRHPPATALFVAGCGADQNPLPRRTAELAEGYGRRLADAVDAALAGDLRPVRGRLSTGFARIDLPFEGIPSREELERRAAAGTGAERLRARHLLERIDRTGPLAPAYPYPIQVWRLGDACTLIALGGEVVVDYSLRLKAELGPDRTWVAAYANDVMGYIPSRRVLAEGGYEAEGSGVYYGLPSKWTPEVEDRIVAAVRKMTDEK